MLRAILLSACLALPSHAWATESNPSTDRSADLEAFETGVLIADQSYSPEARTEAIARFEALEAEAGTMSDPEFELALAEIIALADNGHSIIWATSWATSYPRLAVRFLIADDGLHVADASPAHADLIGARVETLAGHDLDSLRAIWSRYSSGQEGWRDQFMYFFLESPAILHAAGLSRAADAVGLTLADGRSAEIGTSEDWPALEGLWAVLPPSRKLELYEAGRVAGEPLYLQEPDCYYRLVDLPARDAVYIQFRANVDFDGRYDMAEAARAAIAQLQVRRPRFVIVDQRFNLGGDLNTTRDLMQAIPGIVGPEGHVFAIISGRTFSAGISSVGYLEQAGGEHVTIVGAPVGDRLEFWSEADPVELPQLGSHIGLATERHNYRTGCPEPDCHGSVQVNPIRVDDLDPDYRPAFTYEDFVFGRDPYLEAVFALMNEQG